MRHHLPFAVALACGLALWGCDSGAAGGASPSDAAADVAPGDATAEPDSHPDSAAPDAGPADATPPDGMAPDMASPDMASPDMASPDMASPDMASPDMAPDLGPPAVCGDGVVEGDEGCDDGGREAGDGCDVDCAIEEGWACDSAVIEPVEIEVDGLEDCAADPVRPALDVWPAWRAVYVGGAVLYSANEDPWSHRFDVRVEPAGRDRMPFDLMFGEGRYASAEEAEAAGLGRATAPFYVGHRDRVAVWFPDAECAGNEGRLTVRFEAVSACRPIGPELCDNGLDDDLDGAADCAQDDCRAACAERFCGDAVLDPGEGCDDGVRIDGEGCTADCRVEVGYACMPFAPAAVPATIDAFDHCVPGGPGGVPVGLEAGAWRAYYVGGAAVFSINADPWAARFVVRIEGPDGPRDLPVGAGRFPSAEAASAAVAGQFTPAFTVGPDDAVSAFFPDDDCNRNEGTIDVIFRRIAECAEVDP